MAGKQRKATVVQRTSKRSSKPRPSEEFIEISSGEEECQKEPRLSGALRGLDPRNMLATPSTEKTVEHNDDKDDEADDNDGDDVNHEPKPGSHPHMTRGSRYGRTTDLTIYDQKYHPIDEVTRPKRTAKRLPGSRSLSVAALRDSQETSEDSLPSSAKSSRDEGEESASSETDELPQRTPDPGATRHSKRTEARKEVNYSKRHHPQDHSLPGYQHKASKLSHVRSRIGRKTRKQASPTLQDRSERKSSNNPSPLDAGSEGEGSAEITQQSRPQKRLRTLDDDRSSPRKLTRKKRANKSQPADSDPLLEDMNQDDVDALVDDFAGDGTRALKAGNDEKFTTPSAARGVAQGPTNAKKGARSATTTTISSSMDKSMAAPANTLPLDEDSLEHEADGSSKAPLRAEGNHAAVKVRTKQPRDSTRQRSLLDSNTQQADQNGSRVIDTLPPFDRMSEDSEPPGSAFDKRPQARLNSYYVVGNNRAPVDHKSQARMPEYDGANDSMNETTMGVGHDASILNATIQAATAPRPRQISTSTLKASSQTASSSSTMRTTSRSDWEKEKPGLSERALDSHRTGTEAHPSSTSIPQRRPSRLAEISLTQPRQLESGGVQHQQPVGTYVTPLTSFKGRTANHSEYTPVQQQSQATPTGTAQRAMHARAPQPGLVSNTQQPGPRAFGSDVSIPGFLSSASDDYDNDENDLDEQEHQEDEQSSSTRPSSPSKEIESI